MTTTESIKAQTRADEISNEQRRRKQTLERAKANHLMRQLQMRLQYARLKVEHGWQRQNLNEVENLYFHHSAVSKPVLPNPPARAQPIVAHLAAPDVLTPAPGTSTLEPSVEGGADATPSESASNLGGSGDAMAVDGGAAGDIHLDPRILSESNPDHAQNPIDPHLDATAHAKPPTNPNWASVPNLNPNLNLPPFTTPHQNISHPSTQYLPHALHHNHPSTSPPPISTLQSMPSLPHPLPAPLQSQPSSGLQPTDLPHADTFIPPTDGSPWPHSDTNTASTIPASADSNPTPAQNTNSNNPFSASTLTYDSFWSGFRGSPLPPSAGLPFTSPPGPLFATSTPTTNVPTNSNSKPTKSKSRNTTFAPASFDLDMASGMAHNLGLSNIGVGMDIGMGE